MKRFFILFILISGCVTIKSVFEVNVDRDFPQNEIRRIAVLTLETSLRNEEEIDSGKTIMASDAGTIIAGIMARELAKSERYVVLDRGLLEEKLKLMGLREKDLLKKGNYLDLGRSLSIDAVVVGEVYRFDTSYKKLVSRFLSSVETRVSFLARCMDVTANKTVWSIKVDETSTDVNESSLASELIKKAVKTLATEIK